MARQHRGARPEEILRLGICEGDEAVLVHHDDRMADGVDGKLRYMGRAVGSIGRVTAHAASLHGVGSPKATRRSRKTVRGSVSVMMDWRRVELAAPMRSRYQPRCLRA